MEMFSSTEEGQASGELRLVDRDAHPRARRMTRDALDLFVVRASVLASKGVYNQALAS